MLGTNFELRRGKDSSVTFPDSEGGMIFGYSGAKVLAIVAIAAVLLGFVWVVFASQKRSSHGKDDNFPKGYDNMGSLE